jgi:LmbE family N-acetylglucosaminyl deacetylase/fructoselysine-6-P-deglycase FrlB-like protein
MEALDVRVATRGTDGSLRDPGKLAAAMGPGPWLVVAPHDDDLVLGLGLTVAAAAAQGIEVHVAVCTDGSMGYVELHEQATLAETRARELEASVRLLGLDPARVHQLGFRDGSLGSVQGCRAPGDTPALGQRLVQLLRAVRPSSVFVCTPRDLHPDHRVTASETEMACIWASSRIWLELGAPIPAPALFHYAVYCAFDRAPELEVTGSAALLDRKLAALAAFASQGFIEPMVARIRADGPFEYLARAAEAPYRPRAYRALFERPSLRPGVGEAFRADCELSLDVLRSFPDGGVPMLERVLAFPERPLLVIGEGSSQLFPGRFASWLALRGGLGSRILHAGGREAAAMRLDTVTPCFVSNSGATRELVELARVHGENAVAVLGTSAGPLASLVAQHTAVLPRAERVVAATASVFAQALYLAQAVLGAAGYRPPLARLERELGRVLALDVSGLGALSARVKRVFWADPGHGVAAELALKTMEVCSLPGIYAPGNLLLHGIEEVLGDDDLVVWIDPSAEDAALRDAIARSSGASMLVIGDDASHLPVTDVGPLTPLAQLVLGYRLVAALAIVQGRDPDRPRRARKVGNPAV